MSIERITLSQQAREQLVRLKRFTKLQHWNSLCRWAFCISLAEQAPPPRIKVPADSSVEMSWKTFAGSHHEIYWALLKERCRGDGLGTNEEVLAEQFRLHLHRGIGYLAGDRKIRSIADLLRKAVQAPALSA
jgi:DNA sulfur modification protein DndE